MRLRILLLAALIGGGVLVATRTNPTTLAEGQEAPTTAQLASQPALDSEGPADTSGLRGEDPDRPLARKVVAEAEPKSGASPALGRAEVRAFATPLTAATARPTQPSTAMQVPCTAQGAKLGLEVAQNHVAVLVGPTIAPRIFTEGTWHPPLSELVTREPLRVEVARSAGAGAAPLEISVLGSFEDPENADVLLPWRWSSEPLAGAQAALPNVEGMVLVTAKSGALRGAWQGTLPVQGNRITIPLEDTWTAFGRLEGFPGPADDGACVVTVRAKETHLGQVLASAAVQPDGTWRATGIPRLDGLPHLLRIEDRRALPSQSTVLVPPGTAQLEVALRWDAGSHQQVKVTDDAGQPVPQVNVNMQWATDGAWNRMYAQTDERGLADFFHGPEATAYFRLVSSKYSTKAQGPWHIPTHESQTIPIQANPTAALEGQLAPLELAAEGFAIACWSEDGPPVIERFGPEAEGKFRLKQLQKEVVYVSATCPNGASSPASSAIDLRQEQVATVELQLAPARQVGGRVVDHLTGHGISGATVQARWGSGRGQLLEDLPTQVVTGTGGFFQGLPVPHGTIRLLAGAEGMAQASLDFAGEHQDGDQLPAIRLQALGELRVQLLGAAEDLESYRFLDESVAGTETRNFDAEGKVTFPACPPKEYAHVSVETPIGSLYQLLISMPTAESWDVPILVQAQESYVADYAAVAAEGHEGPFQIRSQYLDSNGFSVIHTRHAKSPDHTYTFRDLPPGPCSVTLYSGTEKVSVHTVDLSDPANGRFDLGPVTDRGAVRLVLQDGTPLSTAVIHLAPSNAPGLALIAVKDLEGTLDLSNLDLGTADVLVRSDAPPGSVFHASFPVVGDPESVREVLVEHHASATLRTVDTDQSPLSLPVLLTHASAPYSTLECSGHGDQDFEPIRLSPGAYAWRLNAPAYWPESGVFQAKPGPNELRIVARRAGEVELNGPANTNLVVWSETDGHATTAWQDRVPALGSSTTNAQGQLRLDLPEGPYRVWIQDDAAASTQSFAIQPGAAVSVSL